MSMVSWQKRLLGFNLLLGLGLAGAVFFSLRKAPELRRVRGQVHGLPLELPDIRQVPTQATVLLPKAPGFLFINFWASWCTACAAEVPKLAELRHQINGERLSMIGIASFDELERAVAADKSEPVPYPVLLDRNGDFARSLQVNGLPQSFLISPNGEIIYHVTGKLEDADIKAINTIISASS